MPEMMVWPDSSSVCTRNDGSSCARRFSAMPIFSWSALVFGSTACEITGSGNIIFLENDDLLRIAQRLAGGRFLQADCGRDVTGAHFLDFLALVGMHLQQAADALLAAFDRVVNRVARSHHARIDAEENQLADVRVGRDLEREAGKRLVVARFALSGLVVVVHALDRRNVDRRRHIVDDRIEHRLHALVLERRAAQHRHDLVVDRARAQAELDFLDRQLARLEVFVHQFFVRLGRALDHFLAPFLRLVLEVGGNVPQLELHALGRLVPVDRLHPHQVDHALEFLFGADRDLDRHRIRLEARLHLLVDFEEVRALAVHLVDERKPRHLVLVGLAPHRFRLRLHAADRAIHHARAVEHAQAALDFDREVDVPRRVDDVDAMLGIVAVHPFPEARRRRRGDRNAALLLLLHPVHHRGAVVHFAHLVRDAGIEQDAFGGRGLTGINVGTDADVAIPLDWSFTWHFLLFKLSAVGFQPAAM